ncbi:MAG TPA: NUDIX domain-containing protein [Candidatus Saccharimonadales bacterium]|nr:NUDIX domain-containing protein [Candidatus Saccharimonadales bacterium]
MAKAARAIIIESENILVMYRNKHGDEYYTLVGGRLSDGETPEQALVREVQEETGLVITAARLVFFEDHPEPYNQQYIYLCNVAPHGEVDVQEMSEEGMMNKFEMNIHRPEWIHIASLDKIAFRTPALQTAIVHGIRNGFPSQAVKI